MNQEEELIFLIILAFDKALDKIYIM